MLQDFLANLIVGADTATVGIDTLALGMELQKLNGNDEAAMALEPGTAPSDLGAQNARTMANTARMVTSTFFQANTFLAASVQTTLSAQEHLRLEMASLIDQVMPVVVPSEFEISIDTLLEKTANSLSEEAKQALEKTGAILKKFVLSKLEALQEKNPQANQPQDQAPEEGKDSSPQDLDGIFEGDISFHPELPGPIDCMLDSFAGLSSATQAPRPEADEAPIAVTQEKEEFLQAAAAATGLLLAPSLLAPIHSGKDSPRNNPKRKKKN